MLILLILLYLLLSTAGLILVKTGLNRFHFQTYQIEEYRRFIGYTYYHSEDWNCSHWSRNSIRY